ncbi:MAG: TIR domain-containing protein, partial [Pseudomonadota bacterium]
MSYTHFDDDKLGGGIRWLRDTLQNAVSLRMSDEFRIFLDTDMEPGEPWSKRLDQELESAHFFVPILTPAFFRSEFCRHETLSFLEYERRTNREDLILPIYLVNANVLENRKQRAADKLATQLHKRKYDDWRGLEFRLRDQDAHQKLIGLAEILARRTETEAPISQKSPSRRSALYYLRKSIGAGGKDPEYLLPAADTVSGPHEYKVNSYSSSGFKEASPFLGYVVEGLLKWLPWLVGLSLIVVVLNNIGMGWILHSHKLVFEQSQNVLAELKEAIRDVGLGDQAGNDFHDCGQCPEMVKLPVGTFLMGSPESEAGRDEDEGPQRNVTIRRPFALGKYEVTRAQFA